MTTPANKHHTCGACDNQGTLSWQRYATPEELDEARNDPEVPVQRTDTEATVAVYGCGQHALTSKLAAHTHDATCTAPPTCDCSVAARLADMHDDEIYLQTREAFDDRPRKVAGMRFYVADTGEHLKYDGTELVTWSAGDL